MPSTFSLAPIPIWLVRLANGQPAARCGMYAYSSLDHQVFKPVFMDPGGTIPWPVNSLGGIDFRDNGTEGPFYWEDNGIDRYYLEFWTEGKDQKIDYIDLYPVSSSGGGPPVTVINNLTNFIIDGQFAFSQLKGPISSIPIGQTIIQLVDFAYPPSTLAQGGWVFNKDVVGNTDSLEIIQTSLSSSAPPSNPRGLLTYTCTVAGGGSVLDAAYFTPDVKTFQNETIQFQFQALASGSAPIGVASEVVVIQNFGNGGAPSPTLTTPFPFVWPTVMSTVTIPITVPSTAGKSRGTNNDDFFEIAIRFPIGSTGIYQITNVMGVRGNVLPANYIYDTQAETFYKIANSFQAFIPTGMMMGMWSAAPLRGWVLLQNTTTFGSLASVALHRGLDFFNLYVFLWNNLPNSEAPVSGGRGVTAVGDFNLNKTIGVPPTTDCVFANASGSIGHTNGQTEGAFTKIISAGNLPPLSVTIPFTLGGGTAIFGPDVGPLVYTNTLYQVNPAGSSAPFNVTQPTNWRYTFIKL